MALRRQFRALLDQTVDHQRNTPTKDASGANVAAFATINADVPVAIWPADADPQMAAAFRKRDMLVQYLIVTDRDLSAKARDTIVNGSIAYVVMDAMNFQNTRILSHPVYVMGANLRTV